MTDEEIDKLIEDAVGHEADFWGRICLRRLCHLAAEAEREACAKVAMDHVKPLPKGDDDYCKGYWRGRTVVAGNIAAEIRERAMKPTTHDIIKP